MKPPYTCHYCSRLILPDDDAQRIARHAVAHIECAWAAEDPVWNHKDSIFHATIGALVDGLIVNPQDPNTEEDSCLRQS